MQAGLKATLDCAEAFATTDFRSDLASFRVPTLVIHGTGDKTVPIAATARPAAAGIAHSRLIEYDGAPHGLLASHKQQLFDDVLAFIQGRGDRSAAAVPAAVGARRSQRAVRPRALGPQHRRPHTVTPGC